MKFNDLIKKDWFIITIIYVFSIFIRGYKYGSGNHGHQIPTILKFADPSLYSSNDIFYKFVIENSLYYRIMGEFSKVINLEILFFVSYLISSLIFLLSIYYITKYLFKKQEIAIIASIFLILPQPAMGTEFTFRNITYHITLAIPLLLASIYFLIKDKPIISLILLGISFNIHALLSIFLLGMYTLYYAINFKEINKKHFTIGIIILLVLISPLFLIYGHGDLSLITADKEYITIMKQIDKSHSFPTTWTRAQYITNITLIIFSALIVFYLFKNKKLNNTHKKIAYLLSAIPAYMIIGFVFTIIYPIEIVVALQFFRSTIFLTMFIMIYLAYILYKLWEENNTHTKILVIYTAASIILFDYLPALFASIILAIKICFPKKYKNITSIAIFALSIITLLSLLITLEPYATILKGHALSIVILTLLGIVLLKLPKISNLKIIILPLILLLILTVRIQDKDITNIKDYIQLNKDKTSWENVQLWIKDNTPKDATILAPIYRNGFRTYSQRSVYLEYDLGWGAHFSKELAKKWVEQLNKIGKVKEINRQNLEQLYKNLKEEKIIQLAKEEKITYIVTEKEQILKMPILYENQDYTIYLIE